MRVHVDMDTGDELHEGVKEYARTNGLRLPRAYAELLETGLRVEGDGE